MKDFLKKTETHIVPCIIGGMFYTLVTGVSVSIFIASTIIAIIVSTIVWDKLGLSREEEDGV